MKPCSSVCPSLSPDVSWDDDAPARPRGFIPKPAERQSTPRSTKASHPSGYFPRARDATLQYTFFSLLVPPSEPTDSSSSTPAWGPCMRRSCPYSPQRRARQLSAGRKIFCPPLALSPCDIPERASPPTATKTPTKKRFELASCVRRPGRAVSNAPNACQRILPSIRPRFVDACPSLSLSRNRAGDELCGHTSLTADTDGSFPCKGYQ